MKPLDKAISYVQDKKSKSALVIGPGDSTEIETLIKNGFSVTVVEKRHNIVEKLAENKKLHLIENDICEVDLKKKYDLVVIQWVLHFIESSKQIDIVQSLKTALNKNGVMLINFLGENDDWVLSDECKGYKNGEILNIFEDLTIKDFWEVKKRGEDKAGNMKDWHFFVGIVVN